MSSAAIIDLGSHTTKVGFAGEDAPRASVRTAMGVASSSAASSSSSSSSAAAAAAAASAAAPLTYTVGANVVDSPLSGAVEVVSPLRMGLVADWPMVERLWEHTFTTSLGVDASAQPVVLTEVAWNTAQLRERACEVMFEQHSVPAFFIAKKAVLSCYASARQTGLVVDCGHACTSAVPVFQGDVVTKGIARSALGGLALDDHVLRMLRTQSGLPVRPRCVVAPAGAPPGAPPRQVRASYYRHCAREVAREVRQRFGVATQTSSAAEPSTSAAARSFILPDGTAVALSAERFDVARLLFDASGLERETAEEGAAAAHVARGASDGAAQKAAADAAPRARLRTAQHMQSIPDLILKAVRQIGVELRAELFASVVLTGGNSGYDGFAERFAAEVADIAPGVASHVVAGPASDRALAAWLGASIVGSLSSFNDIAVSRAEYDERGAAAAVQRKCP